MFLSQIFSPNCTLVISFVSLRLYGSHLTLLIVCCFTVLSELLTLLNFLHFSADSPKKADKSPAKPAAAPAEAVCAVF